MANPITYLLQRSIFRLKEFLKHWYVSASKNYWSYVISQIERIDYILALRITFKHLFQPLYKDYSTIGYILGFIFRSLRIFLALIIYTIILLIGGLFFLFWILTPPVLLYNAITGYPI